MYAWVHTLAEIPLTIAPHCPLPEVQSKSSQVRRPGCALGVVGDVEDMSPCRNYAEVRSANPRQTSGIIESDDYHEECVLHFGDKNVETYSHCRYFL